MITINGKEYRNLVEQVQQNQNDIQYLLKEGGTLNEFGIKVVGQVNTAEELPNPSTYEGEYGDAYAVGAESPYYFYIYTRQISGQTGNFWFNVGLFPQPSTVPGPIGPQGIPGEPGARGSLWFTGSGAPTVGSQYQTGDMYLNQTDGNTYRLDNTGNWQRYNNIRGPQGIQGDEGPQGPRGLTGPTGPEGPQGKQGAPFTVAGIVSSVSQLPTPTEETLNQAYLVGMAEDYNLYVATGTAEGGYLWANAGKVESVEGPQGPQGEVGPTGPQGIPGITRPIYSIDANLPSGGTIMQGQVSPPDPPIEINDLVIGSDGNLVRLTGTESLMGMTLFAYTILVSLKGDSGFSPTGIGLLPATATQGTLTESQLSILQANDFNYILLDNEIYNLQDMSHESGYLVYTHVGMDTTKNTFIKTITITTSTRGWVLTTKDVGGYLVNATLSNSSFKMYLSFQFISNTTQDITSVSDLGAFIYKIYGTNKISASGFYGNGGNNIAVGVSALNAAGAMTLYYAQIATFATRAANIQVSSTNVEVTFTKI